MIGGGGTTTARPGLTCVCVVSGSYVCASGGERRVVVATVRGDVALLRGGDTGSGDGEGTGTVYCGCVCVWVCICCCWNWSCRDCWCC